VTAQSGAALITLSSTKMRQDNMTAIQLHDPGVGGFVSK